VITHAPLIGNLIHKTIVSVYGVVVTLVVDVDPALNAPSFIPFTFTVYDPEVNVPMLTVTENGCKTVAQAIPGFTRLYTLMLMTLATVAGLTTTRKT
jgi:hypothetical protein